ncbi:trigger factor [Qiania dongpingensis]|uniref:peptidylprolyl isomerase n=1 Tax=Qiania dongpingensis TaxID=2763669 RepID=A0A7G9G0N5_9FIRM|nr:trigger factor [Qiania dongpingensis]QNM04367.1 trigger factor [Qiania dongpingensis]
MKKGIAVLLCAAMVLSVAACGNKKSEEKTTAAGEETTAGENSGGSEETTAATAEMPEYVSAFDLGDISEYVELGEYKGIEVAAQNTEVTDEEVEAELQSQVENATPLYEEIKEGTVKDGDVVNIDFVGKIDGVAFDGGSGTGTNLTIGSGQFIEGFESGLVGKNIGETVDLNLTFPEDYKQNTDLSGKAVVFTVTINYVQGEEIPQELNDEFVQRISDEYKTVDEYRAYVRSDLESNRKTEARNNKINEAWEKVMNNATFKKDAEELITYIHDSQLAQFKNSLAMYGMELETYLSSMEKTEEEFMTELQEAAKSSAKSQILVRAVVEKENMELTDEEYQEGCKKLAEENGYTLETLQSSYSEKLLMDILLESRIQDFLEQNVVEVENTGSTEETTSTAAE